MNFSMLIDTEANGRCRVHDIVAGKTRWFDDLEQCREYLRYLDQLRRDIPAFGMLTQAHRRNAGRRKADRD